MYKMEGGGACAQREDFKLHLAMHGLNQGTITWAAFRLAGYPHALFVTITDRSRGSERITRENKMDIAGGSMRKPFHLMGLAISQVGPFSPEAMRWIGGPR